MAARETTLAAVHREVARIDARMAALDRSRAILTSVLDGGADRAVIERSEVLP
jgi:hypothetical protein